MDTEQTDAIDIGVDEQLSENFNDHVSLANPVVPVAEQEGALESKDSQKKEYKEGECHIFNYQEFNRMAPRMGSEKDAMRLKHDFTQLNLDVHVHLNLSYDQTFDVLKEASIKDHSKKKYFICCFLTHGSRDLLWAKDTSMHINDILKIFSESSSLKEIPKIFIFQACRGKEAELGISADSTDSGFTTDTEEDYLDFLVINSTYLDTVSFKTSDEEAAKVHGSFFIDEFCRSLEQFSGNLDLLQISTIVNFRMATNFLSRHRDNAQLNRKKQMPCFTSTLRKKVKFNRDMHPDDYSNFSPRGDANFPVEGERAQNSNESFDSSDTQYFDVRRKRHGSGHDSTNYPLSDIKLYDIKKAKRVLFLSVVDKNIGENDSLVRGAVHLRSDFANRKYSQKEFSSYFIKSRILKFLNQSSNQSGAKNSSEVDCLICYIAAYSRYDSVCDARGKNIYRKEIVEEFIGQLNKSFIGKPKIFIFLLCKSLENEKLLDERFYKDVEPAIEFDINTDSNGRRFVVGTDSVDGETNQSINSTYRGLHTNAESTDGGCTGENLIPIHADILEICLTVPDWKHAIGPMNLFREILKKSPTEDFLSLLTEFNCELVEKHNFYQLSKKSFSLTSTLTKTLLLP